MRPRKIARTISPLTNRARRTRFGPHSTEVYGMDADGVRKRLRKAIEGHDPATAFAWCVANGVAPSVASAFLAEKTATPAPSILTALGLEEIVRVRYARIMTAEE